MKKKNYLKIVVAFFALSITMVNIFNFILNIETRYFDLSVWQVLSEAQSFNYGMGDEIPEAERDHTYVSSYSILPRYQELEWKCAYSGSRTTTNTSNGGAEVGYKFLGGSGNYSSTETVVERYENPNGDLMQQLCPQKSEGQLHCTIIDCFGHVTNL